MTLSIKPLIDVDRNFSDWVSSELITTPGNFFPGYSLYGSVQNDTYFIGIDASSATDAVIGAGTTIWLNTDQNTATEYSPFGSIGTDYDVTYVNGAGAVHDLLLAGRCRAERGTASSDPAARLTVRRVAEEQRRRLALRAWATGFLRRPRTTAGAPHV
jgi:hypothetical protein